MAVTPVELSVTNILATSVRLVWARGILWTPIQLFSAGEQGAWYEASDISTLFQDAAGTTAVTVDGDPVGLMLDQSGNAVDASQATSAARPVYKVTPDRLLLDGVDDLLTITVPTGGWDGTMVLATDQGTASYGISIDAGEYTMGGQYFPGDDIVGAVFRDGAMTIDEAEDTEAFYVGNGAKASYGELASFASSWREMSEITIFPLIDTSSGVDFSRAWDDCSGLTIFPLIDTSNGVNFFVAWARCSSLTSFPLIDVSNGTNFNFAWDLCSLLTDFPSNFFDNVNTGSFDFAFGGTNLSEASIDGILVSLVSSGVNSGIRVFGQSGGSAPSVGTGQPAIDTLRSRGWTVTVTGGY